MSAIETIKAPANSKVLRNVYLFALLVLTFTGFGQMPIYRRYHISDIPGLGWSSDFYTTHLIHYLGAILILALFAFLIADFYMSRRKYWQLTKTAYARIFFLGGLIVTGIIRVMKNLPDVTLSPRFILAVDLSHLVFAMLFLFSALFFLIFKKGWLKQKYDKGGG